MLLLVLTIVRGTGGDLYVNLLFEGRGGGGVLCPSFEQKDDTKNTASAGGYIHIARKLRFLVLLLFAFTFIMKYTVKLFSTQDFKSIAHLYWPQCMIIFKVWNGVQFGNYRLNTGLKYFELSCLCCILMFRWINKLPGIQQFWNLCSHYQDIYDWISPFEKTIRLMVYSNSEVYGGKWEWEIRSLVVFTSLKHLIML